MLACAMVAGELVTVGEAGMPSPPPVPLWQFQQPIR